MAGTRRMGAARDETPQRGRGAGWLGWLVAAVLALIVLIGAAAVLIGVVKVNVGSGDSTVKAGRSDDAIRTDVQASLRGDARLPGGSAIVVTVRQGLVTLSGAVATFGQKEAAGEIVQHTAGAVLLDNQIQVTPPTPISDQELQRTIVTGLGLQDVTSQADIAVAVSNGVATLSGTVDSLVVKRRAEGIATSVAGVRDFRDNIAVQPAVTKTDNEITAAIQASIKADPILRDQDIQVRAVDGKVLLTGVVRNLTSRELAENLAIYAPGARAIDNQLQVQP